MSLKHQLGWQRYINRIKDLIGLKDWEIYVSNEPPDDGDALAWFWSDFARKSGVVRFRADFFEAPPDYQRHVVVHELFHAVHAATQHQVRYLLADHMAKGAHSVFSDLYFQSHEYAVDGLAVAVAEFLPEPRIS